MLYRTYSRMKMFHQYVGLGGLLQLPVPAARHPARPDVLRGGAEGAPAGLRPPRGGAQRRRLCVEAGGAGAAGVPAGEVPHMGDPLQVVNLIKTVVKSFTTLWKKFTISSRCNYNIELNNNESFVVKILNFLKAFPFF